MNELNKIADELAREVKSIDKILDALQTAEFLISELRYNGELRRDDMRNIHKYHVQMQNAIKEYVGR